MTVVADGPWPAPVFHRGRGRRGRHRKRPHRMRRAGCRIVVMGLAVAVLPTASLALMRQSPKAPDFPSAMPAGFVYRNTSAWVRPVLDRNILCQHEVAKLRPGVPPVNRIDMTFAWHGPHRSSSRERRVRATARGELHCRFRGRSADSFRFAGASGRPFPLTPRAADRP